MNVSVAFLDDSKRYNVNQQVMSATNMRILVVMTKWLLQTHDNVNVDFDACLNIKQL